MQSESNLTHTLEIFMWHFSYIHLKYKKSRKLHLSVVCRIVHCWHFYSDDKVDISCLCNTYLYDIRKPAVTRLLKHTDCLSSAIFLTRLTVWFVGLCANNSEMSRERRLYLDELSHMLQIPVTALRFHLLNSLSAFYSPQRYSILKNNFLFIGNSVPFFFYVTRK